MSLALAPASGVGPCSAAGKTQTLDAKKPLLWDIFCQVVDNFGDIGVCWRLSAQLAAHGHQVRLWVDDASALSWMAPGGCPGVQVRAWLRPSSRSDSKNRDSECRYSAVACPQMGVDIPGDVVIEAFGCELDAAWVVSKTDLNQPINPNLIANYLIFTSEKLLKNEVKPKTPHDAPPVWINLEYLSAEPYVQRSHGLASPVMHGPAAGRTKWFFYPGFTPGTGGLLGAGDGTTLGDGTMSGDGTISLPAAANARISLFCYEPAALPQLLNQLAHPQAVHHTNLLVTCGRASDWVSEVLHKEKGTFPTWNINTTLLISEHLSVTALPLMSHTAYDALLASCQLNFVRGEDSLARALWAGQAFVWQIYPQDDGAHAAKLDAFLDWLNAPADLRLFHHVWNGLSDQPLPAINLAVWRQTARLARSRLAKLPSLVTQLVQFVHAAQKSP